MFRIKITLNPLRGYGSIPFSYNQLVAQALFKKLSVLGHYDDYFSVSNLQFENMKIENNRIVPEGYVTFISSFLTKWNFQDVYDCLFEKEFSIGDAKSMIQYIISSVKKEEILPAWLTQNKIVDSLTPQLRYTTLSPICVRVKQDNGNDLYLLPGDREYNDLFFEHTYSKWLTFTGQRIDMSKCVYKQEGKLNTKLITIVNNNTPLQVRASLQRFSVIAPVPIHQTLLFAGAGALNSVGFGCVGKM